MKIILMIILILGSAGANAEPRASDEIIKAAGEGIAKQLTKSGIQLAIGNIPFDGRSDNFPFGKMITNTLTNVMINKNIKVVDRNHLEKVLNEQQVQSQALFDSKTLTKLGKLVGASHFLVGHYDANYLALRLTLWVVDVQTGLVVAADQQYEPMTKSLEQDLQAVIPGFVEFNQNIKIYRLNERICQSIEPGMDLSKISGLVKSYYNKSDEFLKSAAYINTFIDPEHVGHQKYDGYMLPSGWTFSDWVFFPVEGPVKTADKDQVEKMFEDVKKSSKKDATEIYDLLKSGKDTGIKVKSWVYRGPESYPSSPYCLPKGGQSFTTNVNKTVRLPVDDGTPLSGISPLNKFAVEIEAALLPKLKGIKGKLAMTTFSSSGISFPSEAVRILENHIMVTLAKDGFQIVDRSVLDQVVAEQNLQQSALFNASTASKIGKLTGASFLLTGSVERTPTRVIFSVRVVDVTTGVFVAQSESSLKNTLALDEELTASEGVSEFSNILTDEMTASEIYNPPAYAGKYWRDRELKFKYGILSDWICSMVSPAGDISGIVQEAFRRNLIQNPASLCKNNGGVVGADGDVITINMDYKSPSKYSGARWKFGVAQFVKNDFCELSSDGKSIHFFQPLTMTGWYFDGDESLTPSEVGGLRENCLQDGIDKWTKQRRDRKKKIR